MKGQEANVTTRRVKELTNIEIDEVSLVDIPANQHARVAIAKRASEEDIVPEIYNENGELLDADLLEPGDTVFDKDGNAFEVVLEEGSEEVAEERELETVGKSFADEIKDELSKAFTGIERDEVIAKALGQVEVLSKRLEQAEVIAKSERDLRLTGEYVEVAKSYNVPVDPTVLGPVLMRMADTMSFDDCSVIHKALTSAGAALFDEVGFIGGADNQDVMSQVDAILDGEIAKSAESISKAAAVEDYFAKNPDAYNQYRADQINR
jgi:hypothetical protein